MKNPLPSFNYISDAIAKWTTANYDKSRTLGFDQPLIINADALSLID
jgi:hypothetical protein